MSQQVDKSPALPLKVAITEDDAVLLERILLPGLRDYGFKVDGFNDATGLYRSLLTQQFDVVILDIALPGEDGLSIAAHLRQIQPGLGVVMLTGTESRDNHLRAMRHGADAYLSKPVDIDIIAATLHSLSRRLERTAKGADSTDAQDGNARWALASDDWCLVPPSGRIIALTTPERALLGLLNANRGQTVEKERLIEALTDNASDFDPHRLEALVHRIRRKAATAAPGSAPLPLLSVRGKGYLLAT